MEDPSSRGLDHPIAAHRLLGDGRSTALIRPGGEIDWWCAPEVDSPPVLWSLLDPAGAAARWVDVRMVSRSQEPAGPATRTVVRAPGGGRVECWDGLVATDGGVALVRAVKVVAAATPGTGDTVELTHELALGGFDRPWVVWSGAGGFAGASSGASSLDGMPIRVLRGGAGAPGAPEVTADGRWLRSAVRATPGRWAGVAITLGAAGDESFDDLVEALGAAEEDQAAKLRSARLPRHHPERARDALAVLGACTVRATGAVVASPTTSLPEAPGGDRQFDYRFTWLRDASLAVSVAALLGRRADAKAYLGFLHGIVGSDEPPAPLTDVRGDPVPEEREIPGVRGWAGSLPVRVGNGAGDQVQFDALGMVVEAISVHMQTGGRLDPRSWELVRRIADHVVEHNGEPTAGIWEFREDAVLVSADLGCWLALDRAIWIARLRHPFTPRRRWKRARRKVHKRLVGALTEHGGLPQCYDEDPPRADAATLMAALFGTFRNRSRRARRLVDATLHDLDAPPFLYRYEPGADDGFTGREGAFLPVSWWAVIALAATGRVKEAHARADAMCAVLPRLFAEEIDPETGESLGNIPLV
ncbi:MAG: hypothetical protein H0T19_07795, partial [Thermoleophilaceae bacterium]|nr:hypothetical protein [Thermoleophilaceae bacterium]